ncbi:IQ domain-containing protein IQM1 [Lolium perenne]|uniref:IQ domain-containing protein IQM1 n=1 Tax=Lolium perenne TaxID=4522 RepID=UPI0021F572E5|nr:IQ domain-containing protein IQM1-like [Lolium perenne]
MSSLSPLNTDRTFHLASPKPQSPRDACAAPLRSPSPRVVAGPPKKKKMARGGLERSISFKNWEADEGRCINGARPGSLVLQSPGTRELQLQQPSPSVACFVSPKPKSELDDAATKLQKLYKGHRCRRNMADCAIVIEELWWKAYDSASLNIKSISFFDEAKQETAASRWSRAGKRIAKVGKGLSKDEKAQKLALQHWLEAIDPRHRYGHNLHLYYDIWSASSSTEPFFYWLDIGAGKDVHHQKCARSKLYSQLIMYLGPNERADYEVIVDKGKLMYRRSGFLVETTEDSKWIFVLSTTRSLYIGQKKKGKFQHSSFLAGAATTAAGRLVAKDGILKAIWPYSGHYLPTEENFKEFISFLEENSVDLTNVKRCSVDDDEYPSFKKTTDEQPTEVEQEEKPTEVEHDQTLDSSEIQLPEMDIVKEMVAEDSAETEAATANLASLPSFKWATAAGARIGCVRDYPADLQSMALEHVNLSPRVVPSPRTNRLPIPSPRPSPKVRLSPRLQYMGLPTPPGRRLPIPSPEIRRSPRQQFTGFQTPAVALTLPKHKGK